MGSRGVETPNILDSSLRCVCHIEYLFLAGVHTCDGAWRNTGAGLAAVWWVSTTWTERSTRASEHPTPVPEDRIRSAVYPLPPRKWEFGETKWDITPLSVRTHWSETHVSKFWTELTFSFVCPGKRWHSSFEVFHLLPIHLHITMSRRYPSHSAPQFSLSSVWLDAAQLSAVCSKLDALWSEMHGMPIVFTWMDWLQNNTMRWWYTCGFWVCLEKDIIF